MKIKQITVFPKENAEEALTTLIVEDADGRDKEITALAGMTLVAITDVDYFSSIQGNIIYPFYALTHDFVKPESMLSQLYFTALATAVKQADQGQLESIFKSQSEIMNFIADRVEELKNENTDKKE